MKSCVLASGGLDSAALLHEALRRGDVVYPLYIRTGLAWERAELHALRRILKAMRCPRLKALTVLRFPVGDLYGAHWAIAGRDVPGRRSPDAAVYLPGRNLILLSLAAVFCERRRLDAVSLGTLRGNPFGDASPRFLSALEKAAGLALGRRIPLRAPFRRMDKKEVLRRHREAPFHLAFSCLSPRGLRPCGRCNKCAERDKALKEL